MTRLEHLSPFESRCSSNEVSSGKSGPLSPMRTADNSDNASDQPMTNFASFQSESFHELCHIVMSSSFSSSAQSSIIRKAENIQIRRQGRQRLCFGPKIWTENLLLIETNESLQSLRVSQANEWWCFGDKPLSTLNHIINSGWRRTGH
jgi:hypothetical protein